MPIGLRTYQVFILILLISSSGIAQIYNTQVEAKINLESNAEYIQIVGSAFNKTEFSQSLRYVLSVIKNDQTSGNRSKNDQSGRIVLNPGQKSNLSQTTINANDKDRIIILLLVYNAEDKLVGKDRYVLNGSEKEQEETRNKLAANNTESVSRDAAYEAGDGILLRGIVIEDTKTKPGRDFYRMFYSSYLSNNINGEKVVTIKETLAIANNTKIEITVGDQKVVEFFLRPQNDYLQNMASESLKRVYLHFENLKREKKSIQRY